MIKQSIILLLSLIYIVNGNYQSCNQYENKIYQLKIKSKGQPPINVLLEFLPDYKFREIYSTENGEGSDIVPFSDVTGYYKCLGNDEMRLTGLGYIYKKPEIDKLKHGAILLSDSYFRFSDDGKSCDGQTKLALFKHGKNPFENNERPFLKSDAASVTCELLSFRPYFNDLTPYDTKRQRPELEAM